MPQLIRHQIGAILLEELRIRGLGVRDVFEGRQEPLTWFFRGVVYDQSELDILESGAVEEIHAPSALVELVVDEMALACVNLGTEGVAAYLAPSDGEGGGSDGTPEPRTLAFHPELLLGWLHLDVAPPGLWLERREADAEANERLALRLAKVAHELGEEVDHVEVHMEGTLDAGTEWSELEEQAGGVRPAGVSLFFSLEIPLEAIGEPRLARIFRRGSRVAAASLERLRELFREG